MKKTILKKSRGPATMSGRLGAFAIGLFAAMCSMQVPAVEIAQSPMYVGSDVPGNLVLVPSVEYPTIISQANIGNYDSARRYSGYFDPEKCYLYHYSTEEEKRHFYPVAKAVSFNCPTEKQWSGNYMNWAATQTIDPFRSALTGGYRVVDTPTETILEKARHHGSGLYPNRRVPASGSNASLVNNVTGSQWDNLTIKIESLGNKMRFTSTGTGSLGGGAAVAYNPAAHVLAKKSSYMESCKEGSAGCVNNGTKKNPKWEREVIAVASDEATVYEVSVRVKVCDTSVGVEANCIKYSQGWKPEGLIQEYSKRIRFSIFGFLNESGNQRNGGVMRARQKFVGPSSYYPEEGILDNVNKEWSPTTGVLIQNPDPDDAADTSAKGIVDSGVINYLNKFGQMTTANPKSNDPVSELYYSALRYFRGQGNVAAYTNGINYTYADGFPVITDWDDPIRYSCQVNAALGIGDVNTHEDRNIPNNPDKDYDLAVKYTQKIFDLEGITTKADAVFSGRGNSAFIAGLAYYANTNDLRKDDAAKPNTVGMQTLSTYWVDVRENQVLLPKATNQYWLTAKYGGFDVPLGFDPLATGSLQESWWHTNTDYLDGSGVIGTKNNYPRPDNFYVASEADKMVASLRQAFESIAKRAEGSSSSFAANSTKLEAGARTFQAQFVTGQNREWAGRLYAYDVDTTTGALTQAWSAADQFPVWGPTNATTNARQIFYNSGGALTAFDGSVNGLSAAVVNYLRGDRSGEQSNGGSFRNRLSLLGDIVNSQPVYVGSPNSRLYINSSFTGASSYAAFASARAGRTPVVYVGANDGMLHAFNANTGKELFAFVPTEGMAKLSGAQKFTDPAYEHTYTVDGAMTAADWFDGTKWRTALIGTMGRGGKSIFALDITDPTSPSLMWEVNDAALGNNLGQPIVSQVGDGDWRVVFGNGPNSTDGIAKLVLIDLADGDVSTISTAAGGDNGLSGVNAWSAAGNGLVDTVYAGDLKGNLWRFKLATGTASLLYAAGPTQPITAAPLVAVNPKTLQTWVFVGTGRYLNSADRANKGVQSWYGLIDRGSIISGTAGLKRVSVVGEGQLGGYDVRVLERVSAPGTDGWYMNLLPSTGVAAGERMVVPNFFQGLTLIGTTRIPDSADVCSPTGKGYTMAIDPFTGGRLSGGFFDTNGDGVIDSKDSLDGAPVSGIGYGSSPNNPIFIGDTMYTSLDDGSYQKIKTNTNSGNIKRVSWRELVGN